jgi:hypothetical protein
MSNIFTLMALRGEGTVSPAFKSHSVGIVEMAGGKTREVVSEMLIGILIGGVCSGSDGNSGMVCVADQILSSFTPTVANRIESA